MLFGCKSKVVENFMPLSNYMLVNDTVAIDMDMDDVVLNGIAVPSVSQSISGIEFKFNVKMDKEYFYKIYYQNESYKFDEKDLLACDNFYGSWEDNALGFKSVAVDGNITDYVRILGNPRDERQYFGKELKLFEITEEKLENVYKSFYNTPEWIESIKQKAINNKHSLERQMFLDAVWILDSRRHEGDVNHRWKRNPRMGCYSFLLVVCDKEALDKIPYYIKDISKQDTLTGKFVNPYTYFLSGDGAKLSNINVIKSNKILKTRAIITPNYGVYVDPVSFKQQEINIDSTQLCNNSRTLYEKALYEQFFHNINMNYSLKNIPIIKDVVGDSYTLQEYEDNAVKYGDDQRVVDYPHVSANPCRTVSVEDGYIKLVNPGNESAMQPKKESVGVKTRVGFTYGKFIGKIKFPELLNNQNVYNGLTNAFWLIFQSEYAWNARRESKAGYVLKDYDYVSGTEPEKQIHINYSEIDIEIVKTSRNWPEDKQTVNEKESGDVMFCCTNWDMACTEPSQYGLKNSVSYKNQQFYAHRWHQYYAASTIRTPISDDEMFKPDFYYYEIEWRPNEIIWRIGPSLDKMKVVGYTSDKYTVIPDNQMTTVVTQEYHYSEWWLPIVFDQNNIPFPKSDTEGRVFEIIVE